MSHLPKEKLNALDPTVIGHRGASGFVPEHTLTAYFIAIQQGADSSSRIWS
jgi:glycerophosphoryl diester phosphodiesterase